MRVQNGGVGLNVLVDGDDDAPPLLLLHGILGCAETWNWMVPRVVDRFRVLRLDFRGHGDSDRAPGRYAFPAYVTDAVAVCERLAGGPVVVVGHSLGGAVAAGLAQTRPDLVRGAVLEDAAFADPVEMDPARTEPADDENSLLDAFRLMRTTIPQAQAAGMTAEQIAPMVAASPYAGGGSMGDFLLDDGLLTLAMGSARVDASVLDPVLNGEFERVHDITKPIEAPVVAVAADPAKPDAVTSQRQLALLEAAGTDVTTYTLPGANHLIHDTDGQREPFWRIVDEFLSKLA